jgi:hypothetical protein
VERRALAALGLLASLAACGGSGGEGREATAAISQADLGDEWALRVDSGILRCESNEGRTSATILVDNTVYAVNSQAKYPGHPIEPIWADAPGGRNKKSIYPLIQRGLDLCDGN